MAETDLRVPMLRFGQALGRPLHYSEEAVPHLFEIGVYDPTLTTPEQARGSLHTHLGTRETELWNKVGRGMFELTPYGRVVDPDIFVGRRATKTTVIRAANPPSFQKYLASLTEKLPTRFPPEGMEEGEVQTKVVSRAVRSTKVRAAALGEQRSRSGLNFCQSCRVTFHDTNFRPGAHLEVHHCLPLGARVERTTHYDELVILCSGCHYLADSWQRYCTKWAEEVPQDRDSVLENLWLFHPSQDREWGKVRLVPQGLDQMLHGIHTCPTE